MAEQAGIDRDKILGNDTVRYTSLHGARVLQGTVEYVTRDAVHVLRDGLRYAVGWARITGHRPRGGRWRHG